MSTHAERLRLRREAKKLTEDVGEDTINFAEEILKECQAIRMLLVKMNTRDAIRSGEEV